MSRRDGSDAGAAAVDDGLPSTTERWVDRVPFLEKELFLLQRVIRPGMVCLDIGAAGGAHLLVMARRVGPGGRVLAFEPRPGSARLLRGLVRAAGVAARTEVVPVALSDGPGRLPLRIPVVPTRAHLPGTTRDRDGTAAFARLPSREVVVPTRALDDVVADAGLARVDLVKVDVEGAELAVLSGAHDTLDRLRPLVLLEADDLHQARYDATAHDVLRAVADHGYRSYRYRRGMLDPTGGRPVADEDDYLLVPDERPPPLPVRGEDAATLVG